jgi:anti-sigma factor RsiW
VTCDDVQTALDAQLIGRLDRADAAALDVHLAGCPECQALVEDARRLQAELRLVGVEGPSPRAWDRVVEGLEADPEFQRVAAAAVQAEQRRHRTDWRWLALAAMLVVLIGSSLFVLRRTLGPAAAHVEAPASATAAVGTDDLVTSIESELDLAARHYENAIAGLERVANESDTPIDPVVMATVRENLQIIDGAIDDSRQALRTDPQSQIAQESLFDAFRRKVALLQDTIALMNEMRKGNPSRATAIASELNKG